MTDSSPLRSAVLRGAVAGPVRTDHGARTELRLESMEGARAHYEARWFLGAKAKEISTDSAAPDAHGKVIVAPGGELQIDLLAGEIPDWLRTFTEKLLRTTARSTSDGRFPRRLTRWREGPGE